jgi:hypothetical protein
MERRPDALPYLFMKSALCGLSPRPNARAPCVQVGPACVRAEQIVLQNDSTAAARHQAAMHLLERAKDLMDARENSFAPKSTRRSS